MIHIGDRVGLLDETGKGTVLSIKGDMAIVLMDDGLEIPYLLTRLVHYPKPATQKSVTAPRKQIPPKKKSSPGKQTQHTSEPPEFDWETWEAKPHLKKVTDKNFRYDPLHDGKQEKKKRAIQTNRTVREIDLHIQELAEQWNGLSNTEIIRIQLDACMDFIEKCMECRARKAIIIHGVGKGTLKQEILAYLGRFSNVQYYDAPYQSYGKGATEVHFFYGKGNGLILPPS